MATRKFPNENLGIMRFITAMHNGQEIEIPYQELTLSFVNGQVCFEHKRTGIILPIARRATLEKIMV